MRFVIQWLAPIGPLIIPRGWARDRLWLIWRGRTVKWLIRQATGDQETIIRLWHIRWTELFLRLKQNEATRPCYQLPNPRRKVTNLRSCLWCTESCDPKCDKFRFFEMKKDLPSWQGYQSNIWVIFLETARPLNKWRLPHVHRLHKRNRNTSNIITA